MGVPSEKLQHRIDRTEEGLEAVGDTQFDAFTYADVIRLKALKDKLEAIIVAVEQELAT